MRLSTDMHPRTQLLCYCTRIGYTWIYKSVGIYIYISTSTYYTCTGTTKRHVCTVRGSLGEANGRIDEGIAKKQGSKCNGICGLEMNQSFKKESILKHESAKESKIT